MLLALIIYFYLIILVVLLSLISKLWFWFRGEWADMPLGVKLQECSDTGILVIGLLGVYGFINKLALVGQLFWQCFAVLFSVYLVASFWFPKMKSTRLEMSNVTFITVVSISLCLISIPINLILLYYGFVTFPDFL